MARPRSFGEDVALNAATDLFWRAIPQAARDGHGALAAHCPAGLFTPRLVAHGPTVWTLRMSLAEDVAP